MKTLTLHWLNNENQLSQHRAHKVISVNNPALSLLSQQCIDSCLPAILAQKTFHSEQVSAKLVVNPSHQLLGIISAAHLSEQNILRIQSEQRIARDEVLIRDLMQIRTNILAIDYEDAKAASIHDVAIALKATGQTYCLVADRQVSVIHGFLSMQDFELDKTLLPYEENAVRFIQLHHIATSA